MKYFSALHLSILVLVISYSCKEKGVINPSLTQGDHLESKEIKRWVGDIESDAKLDDPNFNICGTDDQILQYFNAGQGPVYHSEKPSLIEVFKSKYRPTKAKNQNGLIRIRFIVNCEGKAGRYRILQADSNFKETQFHKKIVSQLEEITKEIENWVVLYDDENLPIDYYYYLIFRITNGQITEILP